jgi:hypothetical protein
MIELLQEIEVFKNWAKITGKYGEWETDYLHWDRIYYLVEKLIKETPVTEWDITLLNEFLYILARDNECEIIIDTLIENPNQLVSIAKHFVSFPDYNARWQIAYGLGEINETNQGIQRLLKELLNDDIEYVRRRASFAYEKKGF